MRDDGDAGGRMPRRRNRKKSRFWQQASAFVAVMQSRIYSSGAARRDGAGDDAAQGALAQATGVAMSAACSADGGRAVPWKISVERQRGADDPLGPAMGPRVQLVVDGRLLLSLMLDGRPVGEKGRLVRGFQEQEIKAPLLRRLVFLA